MNIFDAIKYEVEEKRFLAREGLIIISLKHNRFCIGRKCYMLGLDENFHNYGTATSNEGVAKWLNGEDVELLC